MGDHMKTTVDLSDSLLAEAKALAQRERTTLRALIEQGLRHVLQTRRSTEPFQLRDASVHGGGLTPEMEARGGCAKLREAAYPGFFDDDDEGDNGSGK
jgi:hypothetical protein